jgi:hypothetical protein
MTANDTTPSLGHESSDGADDQQQIQRGGLEVFADSLREEFFRISSKVERGERITQRDLEQVRETLRDAERLLDVIGEEVE